MVANWKMNGSSGFTDNYFSSFSMSETCCSVSFLVPYVYLPKVQSLLSGANTTWGAQNFSQFDAGAYTGEVSLAMLEDFGCSYALVGHSERRSIFKESDQIVAEKFLSCDKRSVVPILCVGESLEERDSGQTFEVLERQLSAVFLHPDFSVKSLTEFVVAYEPVWAIGTGKVATAEQAQEVHAFIRKIIARIIGVELASKVRILYGGSLKPSKSCTIFSCPDVDGGLVGGASLKPADFKEVISLCNKSYLQFTS